MNNQEETSASEPPAVAGPSKVSRKRSQSSSSSSSTSSSSSSSSSSGPKRKRSRRHRRKKSKRSKHSNRMMDKLFKEVGELRKHIATSNNTEVFNNAETGCQDDDASICSGLNGEIHDNFFDDVTPASQCDNPNADFTFEIETKLKDPAIPKTPAPFLKMLADVQRLGNASWSEIRYAETQKSYNHTPGFTDLETNEEVKIYDTLRHLTHTDKSYAALTYCVLKQKEVLQDSIRDLISWARVTEVNSESLSGKVDELFLKGDFHKVSTDLLQLVCGHRAETIEMRRETITSQIRDPLVKASLNRIPPSTNYLFESEPFTAAIEKAGGVRKAFWPPKAESFSQARPNQSSRRPSRGQGARKSTVPSRGTQYVAHEQCGQAVCSHACNNPPSRGGHQYANYPLRAPPSGGQFDFKNFNGRGAFHNRGSRPDRGSNRGRSNSRMFRGNQKRYQQ